MNVFEKNSNRVQRKGGIMYITPYSTSSKIDETNITELTVSATSGDTEIQVETTLGFPTTGSATLGEDSITYTAISGNTITVSTLSSDYSEGTLFITSTTDSYASMDKLGHCESHELNFGYEEPTRVQNERKENIGSWTDAPEPTFTAVLQQSSIHELALQAHGAVSATTENGAYVLKDTDQEDYASIYIALNESIDGSEYYQIFKFPHLRLGASSPLKFDQNQRNHTVNFTVETGENDNYEKGYKVLDERG